MEPQHKVLLEKRYQDLAETLTDVERLVEVLTQSGTLSQADCYELGHNCSSNCDKVSLLLKILMSKDRDHFAEFCSAVETTHPHLHPALLDGGLGPVDHTSGEKSKLQCVSFSKLFYSFIGFYCGTMKGMTFLWANWASYFEYGKSRDPLSFHLSWP